MEIEFISSRFTWNEWLRFLDSLPPLVDRSSNALFRAHNLISNLMAYRRRRGGKHRRRGRTRSRKYYTVSRGGIRL